MAWYKTGTINVTNGQTTVTGTDTKFATNARVGDGFNGPDGNWYEVTNIASETVIAIFPAYQGATIASSANYMIAPLQGYNKESADRLRAITDSLTVVTSVAGKTGNVVVDKYDVGLPNVDNTSDINKPISTATQTALNGKKNNFTVLPIAEGGTGSSTLSTDIVTEGSTNTYFTQNRVLQSPLTGLNTSTTTPVIASDSVLVAAGKLQGQVTSRALKGANNDITSLSALTTAITIAQGGTGSTTQSGARTSLGLGSAAVASIVGTVSQSGGVATGSIIERGSSANGQFVKFADGTMICWLLISVSIAINTSYAAGTLGVQNWAYPSTFTTTPVVFMGARGAGKFTVCSPADATSNTLGSFLVYDPAGGNYTGTFNAFFLAIGRWF